MGSRPRNSLPLKRSDFHFSPIPTAAVVVGILLLLGLGFWQLERLRWKNELNDSRLLAATQPPLVIEETLPGPLAEFTRLRVRGTFIYERQLFVLARTTKGQFGYHSLTPLKLMSGEFLIVDRGWLPQSALGQRLEAKNGHGMVEGFTRSGTAQKNIFVPNNDPSTGFWSHINVGEMADAMGIESPLYYLHATNVEPKGDYPQPQPPRITLRNEHLQYAITWFAMAVALLVVFLVASYKK